MKSLSDVFDYKYNIPNINILHYNPLNELSVNYVLISVCYYIKRINLHSNFISFYNVTSLFPTSKYVSTNIIEYKNTVTNNIRCYKHHGAVAIRKELKI